MLLSFYRNFLHLNVAAFVKFLWSDFWIRHNEVYFYGVFRMIDFMRENG